MESINANAICRECGTAKENSENGFCINGHDDWLEEEDGFKGLFPYLEKFKLGSVYRLKYHIINNICLTDR